MITSFDLFGTLVEVRQPSPHESIATELGKRNIVVPEDWCDAFHENHLDLPAWKEVPLPEHVGAALESRGVTPRDSTEEPESGGREPLHEAVFDAFAPETVETREGVLEAVDCALSYGETGVLSNCSVPGLAELVLERSGIPIECFDVVVTSVGCGYRKPDYRAFGTVANRLNGCVPELVHVGDDPSTDDGLEELGGTAILTEDTSLTEIPDRMEELK
ncbi:MAG: HAD family hydrolase [Halobacteria archaeon]